MSNQVKNCPDKMTLVDYLLGKLPDELLNRCESHFANCVDCEETIRGLNASDTLSQLAVEAVADSQSESDQGDTSAVMSLIRRLQNGPTINRSPNLLDERAVEVTQLLEPAADDLAIGQLAHYRILQLIGAGSTGVVYQAVDKQLDRMVALKILRPSLGQPARERFMAEARSAAAIDHPNVITIYHVGVQGRLAYMAMQWIPGETLEDRLSRVTLLPEEEIRQMGIEIASGLQAAHEKNLIHRDIKPANIWLREETGQAIILDFGLARIADDDPQLTNTGMLAGTPNFMSPEQTRGSEIDRRSDLFSLGCLMYRAATGKLPFGSTGILATLQAIQHHRPGAPQELNPNLGTDFSDLIMCLLEKQPVNRPENADQLIAALQQPRSNWPFVASPAAQPSMQTAAKPKTQSGSSWFRWIAATLLVGALGWTGVMMGPQIIRIMTDQGQLVIDPKDDDVKVEILAGGKVIDVIDTKTKQKINIKSGEYHIQLQGDQNSFQLSPDHVVMMRGGKQIVTITRVNTDSSKSDQAPDQVADDSISLPLVRSRGSDFEVKDAELDVIQAQTEFARAEAAYQHSAELARKEFITQTQLEEGQLALKAADVKLQKATQALERAKVLQKQNAAWQKEVNQVLARKLEVLEENFKGRKLQYESGVASFAEFKKAELEYLDGKLQLLHGDASSGDTGSRNLPQQTIEGADSAGTGPTYDGRSFDQWLAILKTERNRDTIRKGLKALGELSRDDAQMQETAIAAVTPLVRLYGGNIINQNDDDLVEDFNHFFSFFPPQRLIKFILDEIAGGTLQSRKQLMWLLWPGSVYEGQLEMFEKYNDAMRENLDAIWAALIQHMAEFGHNEKELVFNLARRLLNPFFVSNAPFGYIGVAEPKVDPVKLEQISMLLSDSMNSTEDPDARVLIAVLLVEAGFDSETAIEHIAKALTDGNLGDYWIDTIFESIKNVKPEFSGMLVKPLMEFYDNQQLCDRFTEYRKKKNPFGTGGLGGGLGGIPNNSPGDVGSTIINTLASFGAHAEPALDWLDKIANSDSPQKSDAQNAARTIRAANGDRSNY